MDFFNFALGEGIEVTYDAPQPKKPTPIPVACPFCQATGTLRADGEFPLERDTLLKPYGTGQTFTCTHCKSEFVVPTWE